MKYSFRSNHIFVAFVILFTTSILPAVVSASSPLHHELKVELQPDSHHINATDKIILSGRLPKEITFSLHKGLRPSSPTPGVRIERVKERRGPVPLESFSILLPNGVSSFEIKYDGKINHPVKTEEKEQARGFGETPGYIGHEGVFLSGSSYWYPRFGDEMTTFSLEIELPGMWNAVSQGERTQHRREKDRTVVRWESKEVQDEIFLIGGEFTEYSRKGDRVSAMVFLRTPDEGLANRYLEATDGYIAMYEKLIGPYPYKKFALVENFWETGYGMPSFTLLGPKVIRLPFILYSSYPHEILHNWWGNSVYPDYERGNWAEGLTAYLADHLLKEQKGDGVEYRRESLQKYSDYVRNERDFTLTRFRSRHSTPSEAVGYGKSLMLFHMLRMEIGDEAFTRGLQDFYLKNRFRVASFDDIRKSLEAVSGKSLKDEFDQWIARTGAPRIRIMKTKVVKDGNGYLLTAVIEQAQPGPSYRLRIPVAVTMEGLDEAYQTVAVMKEKRFEIKLRLPAYPLRLDIDPEFDIFRRLDQAETPPALTRALGSKRMLIVLPSFSGKELLDAYRELSTALNRSGPDETEVKLDSEITRIPSDRAVVIVGWENRFMKEAISALSDYDVAADQSGTAIGKSRFARVNSSVVLTGPNPNNKKEAVTWIAADGPEAVPSLGRKLSHYHKYSYLVFEGAEATNTLKGRWPVVDSPMAAFFPDKKGKVVKTGMGKLAKRRALIELPPDFSKERMMETINFLSDEKLEGRGLETKGLDLAAGYIAERFREAGLLPAGDKEGGYFQAWEEAGPEQGQKTVMKNVISVIPGKNPSLAGESVVIGAHYDHLGRGWPEVREERFRGMVHPGADDNASGIAVLIEVARKLAAGPKPVRSIVFIAFTGEEAGRMGSKHYHSHAGPYTSDRCIGMINLDTVGRLGKNRLLVLGAGSAGEWPHIFMGAGFVTGVEVEAVAEEVDSSDHKSFHEAGIPAVQLFTGAHLDYHRPTDTADKIDQEGLVKVASVVKEAALYIANRETPLTNTLKPYVDAKPGTKVERKATLGTIPDFSYSGRGYRISGVAPGSPAESAGLTKGDVIVKVDSREVGDLKDLSIILKSLTPGQKVSVSFLREGKEIKVEMEVGGK